MVSALLAQLAPYLIAVVAFAGAWVLGKRTGKTQERQRLEARAAQDREVSWERANEVDQNLVAMDDDDIRRRANQRVRSE